MKYDILVASHKAYKKYAKDDCFKMIQVGAYCKGHIFDLTDDTYDNISSKNSSYCELTAQYWLWKNSNANVKGLCHYRRYFCKYKNLSEVISFLFHKYPFLLSEQEITKTLENYDLILHRFRLSESIRSYYGKHHVETDLDVVRDVIKEIYPSYIDSFDKCMNGDIIYHMNMLISKSEIFDNYSEWLFNILFKVEKRIKIDDRDTYQKRVFGFLSERLLKVWVEHNKLRYKSYYVIMIRE